NGSVIFPPGVTSHQIEVVVIGDDVFEPDETFFVNLSGAVNAVLGKPQGIGTIVNDDDSLVIVPAGMTILAENCVPANGVVDPGETVTVSLALADTGTLPSSNLIAT